MNGRQGLGKMKIAAKYIGFHLMSYIRVNGVGAPVTRIPGITITRHRKYHCQVHVLLSSRLLALNSGGW